MANPIKGASQFLNGIFGQGSDINREIVELDPGTLKGIEDQSLQAARPVEEFNKEISQGVGEQGFMQGQSSMPNPYLGEAIRQKYRSIAHQDLDNIRLQNETQAKFRKSQQLQKSFQMQMAKQNVQTANYEALARANMEAEMARAEVLVNVLGIGGRIGGMYAGGAFDKKEQKQKRSGTWYAPEKNPGPLDWGAGGEEDPSSIMPPSMPSSIARHRP